MKKVFLFVVLLNLILLTQTISIVEACHINATRTYEEWENGVVEVGEEVQWRIELVLLNGLIPGSVPDVEYTDVVVEDKFAAEIELDYIDTMTHGSVSFDTIGDSEELYLTWNVGTLGYMEEAILVFYISTDKNPEGKHEYISPGEYELNSGPTMVYHVNGEKWIEEIDNIKITVHPPEVSSDYPVFGIPVSTFVIMVRNIAIFSFATLLLYSAAMFVRKHNEKSVA